MNERQQEALDFLSATADEHVPVGMHWHAGATTKSMFNPLPMSWMRWWCDHLHKQHHQYTASGEVFVTFCTRCDGLRISGVKW